MPRLFCFGLGYSALRIAERLLGEGWAVAGTCRSPAKLAGLAGRGIEAHLFDRSHPVDAAALAGTTHLLSSVPPDADGDPVLDVHGAEIAALPGLAWAGYLSSTSVYGDTGGEWVDESAPLNPADDHARSRQAAEEGWLSLFRTRGVPVHLFRLSAIYGPGRSAVDQVRAGRARRLHKPGQVFNRIHVEDIARTVRASMDRPDPGAAYNLADDHPTPGAEVVEYACTLLGVEPPPLVPVEEAGLSPTALGFWAASRRVANRRIKEELGVTLAYPSYREGLAAQVASERIAGKIAPASPL